MDTSNKSTIDRFNEAAERRFRLYLATQAGADDSRRKPLGNLVEAPQLLYKFGLMLSAMNLKEGDRVLDFGAGAGWLARGLNHLGVEATGIDVSEAAVEFARRVADEDPFVRADVPLKFVWYDGYTMPFADGFFDQIACFDAFHHVPNKRRVFEEFQRVLRPSGLLTYVEPGGHHGESDQAKNETKEHGVLEDSISLEEIVTLASASGFGSASVLPYPPPDRLRFDLDTLSKFLSGDDSVYPLRAVRRDLAYAFIATFTKGGASNGRLRRPWWRLWQ